MSEDVPIKVLLGEFPKESLELFAPELAKQWGAPKDKEDVSHEILALDLSPKGGFLDVAFKFRWANGSEAIILLVEHWSEARKVCLRRLNRYVAELLIRHEDALVKPVLLVTDSSIESIPKSFRYDVAGKNILRLQYQVFHTNDQWLNKVKKLRNPVGAVLWVLQGKDDVVKRCIQAFEILVDIGIPIHLDQMIRLVGVMQKLARMNDLQSKELLIQLRKAPKMTTIVDLLRAEGIAEGEAKGEIIGEAKLLRRLVARGRMTLEEARAELVWMAKDGQMDESELQMALGLLGN
jgi:hypothetical protein